MQHTHTRPPKTVVGQIEQTEKKLVNGKYSIGLRRTSYKFCNKRKIKIQRRRFRLLRPFLRGRLRREQQKQEKCCDESFEVETENLEIFFLLLDRRLHFSNEKDSLFLSLFSLCLCLAIALTSLSFTCTHTFSISIILFISFPFHVSFSFSFSLSHSLRISISISLSHSLRISLSVSFPSIFYLSVSFSWLFSLCLLLFLYFCPSSPLFCPLFTLTLSLFPSHFLNLEVFQYSPSFDPFFLIPISSSSSPTTAQLSSQAGFVSTVLL